MSLQCTPVTRISPFNLISLTRWSRLTVLGGLLLTIGLLSGCQQRLFPEHASRSPYDRYLTLRGQDRPMTETDPFGMERPALRQRLRPMDRR